MSSPTCCCLALDAAECFQERHPELQRFSDDPDDEVFTGALREVCECRCHAAEFDEDDPYDIYGEEGGKADAAPQPRVGVGEEGVE